MKTVKEKVSAVWVDHSLGRPLAGFRRGGEWKLFWAGTDSVCRLAGVIRRLAETGRVRVLSLGFGWYAEPAEDVK